MMRIGSLVALGCAACAHRPAATPTRFAESAAFSEVRGRTYRILERDLDGDGAHEAVVALRSEHGWTSAVFARAANAERKHVWRLVCEGSAVFGTELGELAWVELSDGPLLLLVGSEENPDEVVQSVVLIDPSDGCAPRLEERLVLNKPSGPVVSPGPIPMGVRVREGVMAITDRPTTVRLEGPEGLTTLLTGVRVRRVGGSREAVEVEETHARLLEPRRVVATWQGDAAVMDLDMITDGSDRTRFVARPNEAGTLHIEAEMDVAVIVVHHGCDGNRGSLHLSVANEPPWSSRAALPPNSFVRAAGRAPGGNELGVQRDLLALKRASRNLALRVGPVDSERCLRQVRAFGFPAKSTASTND